MYMSSWPTSPLNEPVHPPCDTSGNTTGEGDSVMSRWMMRKRTSSGRVRSVPLAPSTPSTPRTPAPSTPRTPRLDAVPLRTSTPMSDDLHLYLSVGDILRGYLASVLCSITLNLVHCPHRLHAMLVLRSSTPLELVFLHFSRMASE